MTAPTNPPGMTAPPDAPNRNNPAVFRVRMDAFLAWLVAWVAELTAIVTNVYDNAVAAFDSATAADASADDSLASSQASAASAQVSAASAGAVGWVAGTNYAVGARVWSPTKQQLYRCINPGVSATDPFIDQINWARVWVEPELMTAESMFMASLF